MSSLSDEFPSNTSDDFGFKQIGNSIQVVSDYEENLPFKHIRNLSYAPHSGLFIAAGLNDLVIGTLTGLKKDIEESKEQYTTDSHRLNISNITTASFTANEKNILITTDTEIKYSPIDLHSFKSLSTTSFQSFTLPGTIDSATASPRYASSIAALTTEKKLYLVDIPTNTSTEIAQDVWSFSWSPDSADIIYTQSDGTIRTSDGSIVITTPEELIEDELLAVSIIWLSSNSFFVLYSQEINFDADDEPSYDFKTFVVDYDSSTKESQFQESFDTVPAFGTVWRKPTTYSASLFGLSDSLPFLDILASSTSSEVSAITGNEQLLPLNDSERASLPINEESGNDINSIGLIVDTRSSDTVVEPCAGVSEAKWLPTVWSLGSDGKIQGWYIFHVHDLKNNSFNEKNVQDHENSIYQQALSSESKFEPSTTEGTGPTDNNSQGLFGSTTTEKPNAFKSKEKSPFGSTTTTTPKFGETPAFSFGNKNTSEPSKESPFASTTSTSSAFGSSTNTPAFGSTGFGASAPKDSNSGFGQSSFGNSSFGQSSFGKSTFGQSTFGSNPENNAQPAFGKSTFGSSIDNKSQSGFGQSSFGSSTDNTAKPAFGKSSFGQSTFGSNTDKKSQPAFGSTSLNADNKTSSGFAAFSQKSDSPFASFGKPADNKGTSLFRSSTGTNQESPFAKFTDNKTTASTSSSAPFSLFGQPTEAKSDSPFASFGLKDNAVDNQFGSGSSTSTPQVSSFPSVASDAAKPSSDSFAGLKLNSALDDASGLNSDAKIQEKNYDGLSSESLSSNNDNTDSDSINDDSEEEDTLPEQQQIITSPPGQTTTASGPTSFGKISFGSGSGSNSGFGTSQFGSSGFGNTGFTFNNKKTTFGTQTQKVEEIKDKIDVGGSGFASFAKEKIDFGSKNIFEEIPESSEVSSSTPRDVAKEEQRNEEEETGIDESSVAEDVQLNDEDDESFQGFNDNTSTQDSENVQFAGEDEQDEREYEHNGDEQFDQTLEERSQSDLFEEEEKLSHENVEESEDEDNESLDGHSIVDKEDTSDLDEALNEALNITDENEEEDRVVNEDLNDALEKELEIKEEDFVETPEKSRVSDEDTRSDSLKSSEEELYEKAKYLQADGSEHTNANEGSTSTDTRDQASQIEKAPHTDTSIQVEIPYKSTGTEPIYQQKDFSIETESITYESVSIQAFENDEVYAGSFNVPATSVPYERLAGVNYPKLSQDPILSEIEKIVYDTAAELTIVEDNANSIGDFINDHLKTEVLHTVQSIDHAYQWRLSEAKTLNRIIASKEANIASLEQSLSSLLETLTDVESKIKSAEYASKTIRQKTLVLEKLNDKVVLNSRDLPLESKLLQEKIRLQHTDIVSKSREVERKILALKTATQVLSNETPNVSVLQEIITHINDMTREYSTDTKKLTQEVSKLNSKHDKILDSLNNNDTQRFNTNGVIDQTFTKLKVDATSKKVFAYRAISNHLKTRTLSNVTADF